MPAPGSFVCHAASGAHDDTHVQIGDHGTLSGTATFRQLFTETEWFPMTVVVLKGPDRTDGTGVRFVRFPRPGDQAAVHLLWPPHQNKWWNQRRIPIGAPMAFALRWAPGTLEIRLPPDEAWTPIALSYRPTELDLACTSSEVAFDAVLLDGQPMRATR